MSKRVNRNKNDYKYKCKENQGECKKKSWPGQWAPVSCFAILRHGDIDTKAKTYKWCGVGNFWNWLIGCHDKNMLEIPDIYEVGVPLCCPLTTSAISHKSLTARTGGGRRMTGRRGGSRLVGVETSLFLTSLRKDDAWHEIAITAGKGSKKHHRDA